MIPLLERKAVSEGGPARAKKNGGNGKSYKSYANRRTKCIGRSQSRKRVGGKPITTEKLKRPLWMNPIRVSREKKKA